MQLDGRDKESALTVKEAIKRLRDERVRTQRYGQAIDMEEMIADFLNECGYDQEVEDIRIFLEQEDTKSYTKLQEQAKETATEFLSSLPS